MPRHIRPRCVVLGLDGLPYFLAQELSHSGRFPNLAHLTLSGQAHPIRAELPEVSPVNWTSFFTATGPEEHGIFGFTSLDPASYHLQLTDFTQVQGPTIFDRLGDRGLTSKVINLPNTYPARALKGMLIAGFVAPDLYNAVHPKVLASMLESKGYKLEADTDRGRNDFDFLLTELRSTLRSRHMALDMLWPDLAWDLFVLVLTETDRLGHFLFPALRDEANPWHRDCLDLLHQWDALIGEVLERYQALPEPKRLLVLADHGFTNLVTEVDLNAWLRQAGLLTIHHPPAHELDATGLDQGSKALALDPGRIFLHDKARFARGGLHAPEAGKLREEIIAGLQGLAWHSQPVMQSVHRGEELYPHCAHPQRPDVVCVPNSGFDLKAKFNREQIFGTFGRQGMHTADDLFFFDSRGEKIQRVREVGQAALSFLCEPQTILM